MNRNPRSTTHIKLRVLEPKPPAQPPTANIFRRHAGMRSESAPKPHKSPNPSARAMQKIPFLDIPAKTPEGRPTFSQTCRLRRQHPLITRVHKIAQLEVNQKAFEREDLQEEHQFFELCKALKIVS